RFSSVFVLAFSVVFTFSFVRVVLFVKNFIREFLSFFLSFRSSIRSDHFHVAFTKNLLKIQSFFIRHVEWINMEYALFAVFLRLDECSREVDVFTFQLAK